MMDKEIRVELNDLTRTLDKSYIKQTELEEHIVNTRTIVREIKEIL